MSALDHKLLEEVREREKKALAKVTVARAMLEDAKDEYQQASVARAHLEAFFKEHDDFNDSASDLLG